MLASSYERFVRPQGLKDGITLNGRHLPSYKDELFHALRADVPTVMVVGSSSQFHMRRAPVEAGLGCRLMQYFNFAYHEMEPVDFDYFTQYVEARLAPGSVLMVGIAPEQFTLFGRRRVFSAEHPWGKAGLWWRNILDGNNSVSQFYPELVRVQWPLKLAAVFPIVDFYSDWLQLLHSGLPSERVGIDGSVGFIDVEEAHNAAGRRDTVTDVKNTIMFAERAISEAWHEPSFTHFATAVARLTGRDITVIAYETVHHPAYAKPFWRDRGRLRPYLASIDRLKSRAGFVYIPWEATFIDLPGGDWLDPVHPTREGSDAIIARLTQKLAGLALCSRLRADAP